jgi:hypothetical protein
MKKLLSACAFTVLALLLIAGQSFAGSIYGLNITVWDKIGTQPAQGSSGENNEVEGASVQTQAWDLEGFYLNGTSLTMIAGFDFKNGQAGYPAGDIFISTNPNSVIYGSTIANPSLNGYGYNYVLDMNYSAQTYQVYAIGTGASVTPTGGANASSSPYLYSGGGTAVGGVRSIQYISSVDLTGTGITTWTPTYTYGADTHYALTVDLGFLPQNTNFFAHITEQCGNDAMAGQGTATPEPATIALVGGGFLILYGYRRFKHVQ